MKNLLNLVHRLNDPMLVAKTQEYFGVKMVGVIKTDPSNDYKKHDDHDNHDDLDNHSDTTDHDHESIDATSGKLKSVDLLNNRKCFYQIKNPFFYWFFLFITHIGNEIFYITFMPAILWCYKDRIVYLTCLSWAFIMYLGQAAKDLIKLPRPPTPPVVKIEQKYLLEYGFPSTHVMAVLNISYTLLTYTFREYDTHPDEHFFFRALLLLTAVTCCFLVSLSRVYLGMHSYLDIIGGLVFSVTLSQIFIRIGDIFFFFVLNSYLSGFGVAVALIVACLLYPNKTRWSPARADTFLIMAVAVGVTLGKTVKIHFARRDLGKIVDYDRDYIYVYRILLGLTLLIIQRFVTKGLVIVAFKLVQRLNLLPRHLTVKQLIQKDYRLEIVYYVCCYASIGFTACFTCFWLFDYVNLV